MPKTEQLFKLLGFAQRARKLTLGMSATTAALKKRHAKVVIIALDTSGKIGDKVDKLAKMTKTPVFHYGKKEGFGLLFGRRKVGIMSLTDSEFAKAIVNILQ